MSLAGPEGPMNGIRVFITFTFLFFINVLAKRKSKANL